MDPSPAYAPLIFLPFIAGIVLAAWRGKPILRRIAERKKPFQLMAIGCGSATIAMFLIMIPVVIIHFALLKSKGIWASLSEGVLAAGVAFAWGVIGTLTTGLANVGLCRLFGIKQPGIDTSEDENPNS